MIKHYFVVEGKTDCDILSNLLPNKIVKVSKFIISGGSNLILSKSRTLLLLTDLPISIIFDTDTIDERLVKEKLNHYESSISQLSNKKNIKLYPVIPEIEFIFFESKTILEKIIGQNISDDILRLGKISPRDTLIKLISMPKLIVKLKLFDLLKKEIFESSPFLNNLTNDLKLII